MAVHEERWMTLVLVPWTKTCVSRWSSLCKGFLEERGYCRTRSGVRPFCQKCRPYCRQKAKSLFQSLAPLSAIFGVKIRPAIWRSAKD